MRPLSTSGPVSSSVLSRQGGIFRAFVTILVVCVPLAGCGSGSMADLRSYVAEVKTRKAAPIEGLPPIKLMLTYTYPCDGEIPCTDPFEPFYLEPATPTCAPDCPTAGSGISPNFDRNREELESFPLDGLRMMGTLEKGDQFWAIVRDPDAIIHRVQIGNYIGQNNGKITGVSEDKIELLEIVPDVLGGWEERNAGIALAE